MLNAFVLDSGYMNKMVFDYDGVSTFWMDFNATNQIIHRIAFDAHNISYLYTTDGGENWSAIWTK
jgi:hypothetical protein